MSALISFLGGSVFRMIWGEISHWWTQKQEHEQEIERMKVQGELEAAEHARNMEAIKTQAELGIKVIQAQADADITKIEVGAWEQAVSDIGKQTGIRIIDIWNGIIRPLLATMALVMVVAEIAQHGFILTDWDHELFGAILGLYVADRALANRGK